MTDKSTTELEGKAFEALRKVIDPEVGLNIVELGLIREVEIKDDSVHVVMILTTPFCPYGPQLLAQARATVEHALERPTTIEMGTQMWDPSLMEEGTGGDWGLF